MPNIHFLPKSRSSAISAMGISLHMKTGAADLESAVALKKSSSPCFISSMP